ncbi:MAG: histidinol dehydrogenase [Proteobacteria bacterium]|nr:histidinol dehydrogenase [Pseudomonadota bacterium]
MPAWLDIRDTGFEAAFAALLAARCETADGVDDTVAAILADVKANGDVAVIAHTKRLDGFDVTPATMRVPTDVVKRAAGACLPETVEALELARDRITDFHRRQIPEDLDYTDGAGFRLGLRWKPLAAVGLYVPGGTAAYPSTVLMNAVPAKIAGVQRVVMVVAAPGGQINPLVLAAADIAGVDEIYRIGGAQAVGALAFGTPTIARVDKIVGPGNVYVAAAKRQVFGIVGIDMIAGPSEILVVADRFNDPAWIAADLLAQAEHDIAAQAILVADDKDFAEAVTEAIQTHLSTLPRAGIAAQSWETFGAVILMESLADAGPLIDRIAPEHLELAVEEPETLAATVCNAGAIFLGRFAPEAIGDYVAGPNHVLPTAGSARFSSGLGVLDFLKRTSLIGCNRESLAAVAPAAVALAKAEGLDAHALSLAIRLNRPQDT